MSQYEEVRVKRFDSQQVEVFGGQTTVNVLGGYFVFGGEYADEPDCVIQVVVARDEDENSLRTSDQIEAEVAHRIALALTKGSKIVRPVNEEDDVL